MRRWLGLVVLLAALLITISSAWGWDNSSCVSYITADTADTSGTNAMTVNTCRLNMTLAAGVKSGYSGVFGEAIFFNSTADRFHAQTTAVIGITGAMPRAFGGWFKVPSWADSRSLMGHGESGAHRPLQLFESSNRIYCWGYNDPACDSTWTVPTNIWFWAACSYNGTHLRVFTNGTPKASCAATLATGEDTTGGISDNTLFGKISFYGDDLFFFNESISDDDAARMYANGTEASFFTPAAPPALSVYNTTLQLFNYYNSSLISGFTVNVGNSTQNATYTATDFNVTLNISGEFWFNFTHPDYFPATIFFNTTQASPIYVNGTTWQAVVIVKAMEYMTNTSLPIFNSTSGTAYNSTTNGTVTLKVDAGTVMPETSATGYWPTGGFTYPITLAAGETGYTNSSLYSSYITVKASTYNGSKAIAVLELNVTWLNYTAWHTNSANNGSVHFYLINGTYNISFTSSGYLSTSGRLTVSGRNHTLHLYTWALNTVNITIRNETTLEILAGPEILLEFISDDFAYNYSTVTGRLFEELLSPADYIIRYWADTYPRRSYVFTLSNETYNEFTLYLLQQGAESNVTIKVVDENNNPLEGVKVNVLRYNQPTNTYILTESPITDFIGEARITAKLYTEYYYFQLYYPSTGGTLEKVTEPAYLTSTDYTLQIIISDIPGSTYFRELGIDYNLTFTDATDNFNFEYSDTYGTVTRACLEVYTLAYGGRTLYNSSCANAASGTILVGVLEANGTTYEADAYAEYSGESHFIATLHKSFIAGMGSGSTGLFLVICLVIVFGAVAVWSIQVAVVLAGMAPMLAAMAGVLEMPVAATIPPLIIGLALALLLGRKPA